MTDFVMPSLGADMESGTLVEWRIAPGREVRRGDVVAVVETQKGAIEIEIFEDGVVEEICVPVGHEAPVGAVLARLAGGAGPRAAPAPPRAVAVPIVPAPSPLVPAAPTLGARHAVSPAARRRAAELGVDITGVRGTGVGGAVCLADVERAAAGRPAVAHRGVFDPAAMRAAIAAAMSRSNREIPHYFLGHSCDLTRAMTWLEQVNAGRPAPERLLLAALLLKAAARALAKLPELNGFWIDGAFRASTGIHVGWAISLRGGGLVAPAIHDANRRSLDELMAAMRDLVLRARGGGLRSSELTDPTVTVTSLGERGAESVLGVIYPPQVALIGFGRPVKRPWVVDGEVCARTVASLTLAGDHRASDGHRGGQLLLAIDQLLREPHEL
jgi:pyruvate dehydrogenase E2 component (dihydrolipoamide acetyltransferase)